MPRPSIDIERQITAIEFRLIQEKKKGKPTYSLEGKLRQLKAELQIAKQFEFLAK